VVGEKQRSQIRADRKQINADKINKLDEVTRYGEEGVGGWVIDS
jgi:hypothetical protein